MITFIASVFVFCLLIFIHEFGHFIAAKAVGVTVHEFAIGMGPKIISWQGKETKYSIRILPIGGYVKLALFEQSVDANPNKIVESITLKSTELAKYTTSSTAGGRTFMIPAITTQKASSKSIISYIFNFSIESTL